jgi:two-component system, NtrC family, nitrogen regulation response regulator NtrX
VTTLLINVLIVDDDPEMRKMLSEVLGDEGYSVETAANGKDAIKACEKRLFDLALIDVGLPDIIGTELLKLKTIQPKMLAVIITGNPSVESAMKAVTLKADGYILKPFEVSVLLQMLKKLDYEETYGYLAMFAEVKRSEALCPVRQESGNR